MKRGKKDGTCDISSDYLLNASNILLVHMSMLFQAIFRHGKCPSAFGSSTVIPLPKNKRKSLADSDNYRSIAIGSIISKLFDLVIMKASECILCCSDYQYGFRSEHSTIQCTFVLKETVQYYKNGGSNVHAMFLDASKAFDKVQHIRLFRVLKAKGICPMTLRVLIILYADQRLRIRWGTAHSRDVPVSNGVKQGGVISPVLFTNYIDELLKRLRASGLVWYIGHTFCGSFGYADDVALLAPTRSCLRSMLSICDSFAEEFLLTFNPIKSKYLVFRDSTNVHQALSFRWRDLILKESPNEVHLGTSVETGTGDARAMVHQAVCQFYARFNVVISNFSFCSNSVKYFLFKSLCMSVYTSQLWDFESRSVEQFFVAWRKAIRRLLRLPSRTHNCLLHLIVNDMPVECQLHRRFVKFFFKCTYSSNACTRVCTHLATLNSNSNVSNSLNHISSLYRFHYSDFQLCSLSNILPLIHRTSDVHEIQRASAIIDFLNFQNSSIDHNNINFILNFLCTDEISH